MSCGDYLKYKEELCSRLEILYEKPDLFGVIELLENSELDFDLCMELCRTYINVANKSGDPYTLYEKADAILDKTAADGRNDPRWQFFKGYLLYKSNLANDALMCFERALRFASIDDQKLFSNIIALKENCERDIALSEVKSLDDFCKNELLTFYEKHFGRVSHLCSMGKNDLYLIGPNGVRDYVMIVSLGLSAKAVHAPDGTTEHFEICLALPSDYRFVQDTEKNFEVYMLLEVMNYLLCEKSYIGFGYYLQKEGGFARHTAFNGIMLAGVGDCDEHSQGYERQNGERVNIYEMIPLRPMELNFRKTHTAFELLEKFREKRIMLTPFIASRPDCVAEVESSLA